MAPAVYFQHRRNHSDASSSDVFGNELHDVDVWGDVASSEECPSSLLSKEGNSEFVRRALGIMEDKPGPPPLSPQRLLQSPSSSCRKVMMVKPPLRRSFGSEGNTSRTMAAFQPNDIGNALPPLTPRASLHKLRKQIYVPKMESPSTFEKRKILPQSMSVAEKRRLRHEYLHAYCEGPQNGMDGGFHKVEGQTFDLSNTHTGTIAQADSSLSSLSLCRSHFTSASCGDSINSLESMEMPKSQNSVSSLKRREKSSSTGNDIAAFSPDRKVKDVNDLQYRIQMALEQCTSRDPSPTVGRTCEIEAFSMGIPPTAKSTFSSHTPRAPIRKSSVGRVKAQRDSATPPCVENTPFLRCGIQDCNDGRSRNSVQSTHSHSVRSSSSSGLRRFKRSDAIAPPTKTMQPDTKPPPLRSCSDCHPKISCAEKVTTTSMPPRTRSLECFEKYSKASTTKRSPSPCTMRKSSSGKEKRSTRSSSSSRKMKSVKEVDIFSNNSITKLKF
ncbi:hypothetical protein IV203_008942 [Nitzschia inconspicua]|uniref:Uncharacterized protein n=1 Tax=Nitzschia inconspicua TaxID=303405 RepID=A0A9K3KZH9_9STRA|nr:hypothetical protein IV203_008942 [Nitzschia inconspicua]